MAIVNVTATAKANLTNGTHLFTIGRAPDHNALAATTNTDGATMVTDRTTVAANVATLVADGASPTQAHVTTLNTNWGTLSAQITVVAQDAAAAAAASGADVTLSINPANVTTLSQLRQIVNGILHTLQGSSTLLP